MGVCGCACVRACVRGRVSADTGSVDKSVFLEVVVIKLCLTIDLLVQTVVHLPITQRGGGSEGGEGEFAIRRPNLRCDGRTNGTELFSVTLKTKAHLQQQILRPIAANI